MIKLPLNDIHEALGGKMTPFAGFMMPVRYSSDIEEHLCVRNGVGVFDVSHMGEFIIKGPNALALIQKVSANDAAELYDGRVQYSYMPNETGGVVDDLLIYRVDAEHYYVVVNASNIEKDWDWITSQNTMGAEMINVSADTCLFAVQGPKALAVLQKLTDTDLSTMPYYHFRYATLAGINPIMISSTGYTGSGGFELYVPNGQAEHIWHAIFEAGKDLHIKPIGLGARDTLRLEKGFCLYGNDIDDGTSPLEAGLGWVTKFSKDFIYAADLKAQKEKGLSRKLVGFELTERGIPRGHYDICDAAGEVIGQVTSGTMSPSLNKGIGMGYVPVAYAKPESEIYIKVREKLLKAAVKKMPLL